MLAYGDIVQRLINYLNTAAVDREQQVCTLNEIEKTQKEKKQSVISAEPLIPLIDLQSDEGTQDLCMLLKR